MLKPNEPSAAQHQSPVLHGFAMAASAVPASLLLGYLGEAYVHGFDGLIMGLALLGGTILSAIVITPALQGSGTGSLPEFLARRFGPTAGALALLVLTAAAMSLITADLGLTSHVISAMTGVSDGAVILALALSAAALSLVAKSRAGPLVLCGLALLLVGSVMASVWLVAGGDVLPHMSYGLAVKEISGHETSMMDGGLADFRSLKAHARAFLELDPLNTAALAATLLAGAVILIPASKQRHLTARGSRLATVIVAMTSMALLISIPALASYAKREVYATIARGTPLTALPNWLAPLSQADLVRIHGVSAKILDDVTLAIANDPAPDAAKVQAALAKDRALAATAQAFAEAKPQVKTALIEAAKSKATLSMATSWALLQDGVLQQAALAQNNKTGLLTHGALTLSPWGVPMLLAGISIAPGLVLGLLIAAFVIAATATIRRLVSGAVSALGAVSPAAEISGTFVLIALCVSAALLNASLDGQWLALTGFSIAAAGLFPALVAGAWSKRWSRAAALASMLVGALAALSYSVATHVFPAETYAFAPSLSNASDGTRKKFESLKTAWEKAPDGAQKDAAWTAVETYAAGNATRPNMAEWWGISSASSAIFALPLALLVLLLVELPMHLSRRQR